MGYAFLILGLIGFLSACVMGSVALYKKKNNAKKRFFLALLFLALFFIGAYEIGSSQNDKTIEEAQEDVSSKEDGSRQIDATSDEINQEQLNYLIGVSPTEFTSAFNTITDGYKTDFLHITSLKMESKAFNYTFTEHISMVGTLNSEKKIEEVMLIADKGFSEENSENLLTAIMTLIMTSNITYNYEDAQGILKDIRLLEDDINLQDFDGATVRDGLKYRFKIEDNNLSTFNIRASQ